jgi:hypothetical protein
VTEALVVRYGGRARGVVSLPLPAPVAPAGSRWAGGGQWNGRKICVIRSWQGDVVHLQRPGPDGRTDGAGALHCVASDDGGGRGRSKWTGARLGQRAVAFAFVRNQTANLRWPWSCHTFPMGSHSCESACHSKSGCGD